MAAHHALVIACEPEHGMIDALVVCLFVIARPRETATIVTKTK